MNNQSLICKTTRYGAAICMAVPIGHMAIPIVPTTARVIWRRMDFEGKANKWPEETEENYQWMIELYNHPSNHWRRRKRDPILNLSICLPVLQEIKKN